MREKNLLKMICDFDINRYLMSNADGRWDGAEKAQRHLRLSNWFTAWWFELSGEDAGKRFHLRSGKFKDENVARLVHDSTTPLTDYLDEVIGFPLEGRPDYNTLSPKFFDKFYELATTKLQEISDSLK